MESTGRGSYNCKKKEREGRKKGIRGNELIMICGRLEGRCHRRGKSFLVVGPRLFILFGEKVAHLIFSLSLSLSGQFQIGERITTELIITDVLSVNRGIASRGNFEEDTNLNIFEISNSNSDQCFEMVVIGLRGLLTYRERRPSSIESKNKKRKRTFSMESFEREREREKSINLSTRFEILKMMIFNGTRNFSVFFLLLVRFLLRSTMILREFEDSLAGYEIGN